MHEEPLLSKDPVAYSGEKLQKIDITDNPTPEEKTQNLRAW